MLSKRLIWSCIILRLILECFWGCVCWSCFGWFWLERAILRKEVSDFFKQNINCCYYNFFLEWPIFLALLLTIPSAVGIVYFVFWQTTILRFEYIICAIQLSLQGSEIVCGFLCLLPCCKPPEYY